MQEHGMDTGTLAKRARRGDVEAFTRLVRNYQSMAFGYAYSRLGDFDLAEEAAQQAFITAYRSLDKLRQPERFGGWLKSIVYFECAHIRRARSFSELPLDIADDVSGSTDLHAGVEDNEGFARVFEAIRSLPQAEREATILYYLHDHSQREVAAFLDVPVSTVNNRLRTARRSLKEELIAMADNAFNEHRLPDSFASRIGEIVRTEGPVIDVRFDAGQRPRILNALTVTGEGSDPVTTVEAIQFLGEDLVRCVPVTPGTSRIDTRMRVMDTGGPIRIPLGTNAIRQVMTSVENAAPARAFMETGIKVLDLLVPLPRRGRIAFVGDMNSGKMVLVDELIHRLEDTDAELLIYIFVQTPDEASAINALEYRASRNVAAIYLPVADARPEALHGLTDGLDAVITFSGELGRQHLWPAIDPIQSRSRLLEEHIVSREHRAVAEQGLEALRIGDGDQALREFLAQPFFVAEPYTGQPGTTVPLEDALRDLETILR